MELEPIELVNFKCVENGTQSTLTYGPNRIVLSPVEFDLVLHLKQGGTLQSLIENYQRSNQSTPYSFILKTLIFLCDSGLFVKEEQIRKFLVGFQLKYDWSDSWARTAFKSWSLGRLPKSTLTWNLELIVALLCFAIVGFCSYWSQMINFPTQTNFGINELLLCFALTWICVFSKNVLWLAICWASSQSTVPLQIVWRPLGPTVEGKLGNCETNSYIWGRILGWCSALFILFAVSFKFARRVELGLPGVQWPFGNYPIPGLEGVLLIVGSLLLYEISPFSKSDFTKTLIFWSNKFAIRKRLTTGASDLRADSYHATIIHIAFMGIWACVQSLILINLAYWFHAISDHGLSPMNSASLFHHTLLLGLTLLFLSEVIPHLVGKINLRTKIERILGSHRKERKTLAAYLGDGPVEVLRRVAPFKHLTEETLSSVAERCSIIELEPGDIVCEQGANDRDMFLVISGQVEVFRKNKLGYRKKLLHLSESSLFGEVSFFTGAQRTADVIASRKTTLLEIPYLSSGKDFGKDSPLFKSLKDRIWLLQTLMSSKLLMRLPEEAIELILASGKIHKMRSGQVLIREGDTGAQLYLLIQGRVEVTQNGEFVREMRRGDVFGEISLIQKAPRSATVKTTDTLQVLVIGSKEFDNLLSKNLALGLFFERIVKHRIKADKTRTSAA